MRIFKGIFNDEDEDEGEKQKPDEWNFKWQGTFSRYLPATLAYDEDFDGVDGDDEEPGGPTSANQCYGAY